MKSKPRPKAYSYLRFSTSEQVKGDSSRRQKAAAEKYADTNHLDLDTEFTFEDLGVSAFRGSNRDAKLGAFIGALESGIIQPGCYLLVESLDRLSRDYVMEALKQLSDIVNHGVTVVTLTDGKEYTRKSLQQDTMTLMYSLLIMGRANEESATKSYRLREAWGTKRKEAASKGTVLTSRAPAWLSVEKDHFVVVEKRGAVIRRIFQLTLEGMGKGRIARLFNSEGVETFGKSNGWHPSYIQKILESEAVIGLFQPHRTEIDSATGRKRSVPDGERIDGYFPAVIEEAVFLRARDVRQGRRIKTGKAGKRFSNLFAGIAFCAVCGGSMHFINSGNGWTYLRCSNSKRKVGNCSSKAIPYTSTEQTFLEATPYFIDYKTAFPENHKTATDTLNILENDYMVAAEKLKKTSAAIERLLDLLQEGTDSPALRERLIKLETAKAKEERLLAETKLRYEGEVDRLAHLERDFDAVKKTVQEWLDMKDKDDASAFSIRSKINQVLKRVFSELRFDEDCIDLVFRQKQTLPDGSTATHCRIFITDHA